MWMGKPYHSIVRNYSTIVLVCTFVERHAEYVQELLIKYRVSPFFFRVRKAHIVCSIVVLRNSDC
jgi:hypothetical protein